MTTTDTHGSSRKGWIGVDLDGTLAQYHGWKGASHIGPPIMTMVERVNKWINAGIEVRIMTARVAPGKPDRQECIDAINKWSMMVFSRYLPLTHEKDYSMIELWDDRCVQVIPNTGVRADSILERIAHWFWMRLCKMGNHDWRDGPGSHCRTCGLYDDIFGPPPPDGGFPTKK